MNLWSDAQTNRIIELWHDRNTSSQIAEKMKITRNAVIGKLARMGMPVNKKFIQREKSSYQAIYKPKSPTRNNRKYDYAFTETSPSNVEWIAAKPHHCHWPILKTHVCGQNIIKKSPYCQKHQDLSLNKPIVSKTNKNKSN